MTTPQKQVETRVLAVLADHIPDWTQQQKALGRIMDIVFPTRSISASLAMVGALAEVMQLDPTLNRGQLDKLANTMLSLHYTPEQILRCYSSDPGSPWSKDWRSKGGTQPPGEKALRATIAMFLKQRGDSEVINLD